MAGDEDAVSAFLAVASAREAKLRHRAVRPPCTNSGRQMLTMHHARHSFHLFFVRPMLVVECHCC